MDLPAFEALHRLSRPRLLAAVHCATPAFTAGYEHPAWREQATWAALGDALVKALADPTEPNAPHNAVPAWLKRLAGSRLDRLTEDLAWTSQLFADLRTLERLGLLELDHDDRYVIAMINGLRSNVAARLRADPELLAGTFWRVFEVEGNQRVSLANIARWDDERGWSPAIIELVAAADLPRERVLTSCLQALRRDFSAYRAGWFMRMYALLEPTADEHAARQALLRSLIVSNVRATSSFAVRTLANVDTNGLLDDDAFVEEGSGTVATLTQTSALTTLRVLDRIARRRGDLAGRAAIAASAGLEHPKGVVQRAALAVLQAMDGEPGAMARAEASSRVEWLEPSARAQAADWLGLPATPEAHEPRAVLGAAHPSIATDDEPMPTTAPAEVAERLAALLEDPLDAVALESTLAALALLEDRGSRLAPLARRARHLQRRAEIEYQASLRTNLALLVLRLTGQPATSTPAPPAKSQHHLAARLEEITQRLVDDSAPAVLLATPTCRCGWLEGAVLVERLTQARGAVGHHDLVAALLRVHPRGRQQALAAAASLTGEIGDVVRYALGGPPAKIRTPAWWVAAARARRPLDDDQHLLAHGLTLPGQGAAAVHGTSFGTGTHVRRTRILMVDGHLRTEDEYAKHATWAVDVETRGGPAASRPDGEPTWIVDQPTVVPAQGPDDPGAWTVGLGGDWIAWLALVWPHDAETFFAIGFDSVAALSRHGSPSAEPRAVLDALRSHPGRLGALAATTLAVGLSVKPPVERLQAIEAFVELLASGRLSAPALAAAMAGALTLCRPARWAGSLREAATFGPDGARAVRAVLSDLLPRLPPKTRGTNALREALAP